MARLSGRDGVGGTKRGDRADRRRRKASPVSSRDHGGRPRPSRGHERALEAIWAASPRHRSEDIALGYSLSSASADIQDAPEHSWRTSIDDPGPRGARACEGPGDPGRLAGRWAGRRCGVQVSLHSTTRQGRHSGTTAARDGRARGGTLMSDLARTAAHHTHIAFARDRRPTARAKRRRPVTGVSLRPDRRAVRLSPDRSYSPAEASSATTSSWHSTARREGAPVPGGPERTAMRSAWPRARAAVRNGTACAVTPLLAQPSHLAVTRAVIEHGGIVVTARSPSVDESQRAFRWGSRSGAQPGRVAYLVFDERIATAVGDTIRSSPCRPTANVTAVRARSACSASSSSYRRRRCRRLWMSTTRRVARDPFVGEAPRAPHGRTTDFA